MMHTHSRKSPTFARQQVLRLTGARSTLLSYWDRTGLVVPEKEGHVRHPKVTYTFEQILQIQIVQRLRERLSLQSIRRIIFELVGADRAARGID
jgi:DNA-binding transcriptional MerR regulator